MNRITTVDVHVAGEPLRVITGGFPEPEGHSILEKREFCRQHLDHFRRALILEPRGHEDMYGALPVTPTPIRNPILECCFFITKATARCAGTELSGS